MRQLQDIAREQADMATIVQLTNAFEGLASMRIAHIKSQVLEAQKFFDELWNIYRQLRVDSLFRFGREHTETVSDKELYIVISASGGFSGDIDQRLIATMLKTFDKAKHDIIIVGHHGSLLLVQAGIPFKRYFDMPEHDDSLNVEPLMRETRNYKNTTIFYQAYLSLMSQEIRRLELSAAVKQRGEQAAVTKDIISESNYIFEPSAFDVIAHLEGSMVQITLSQVIFDSKLAQYASRFRAMSAAHERADDSLDELALLYNRSRRTLRDNRLKEILVGLRKAGV
jgi:F-type H+-transporting ATPase subunit gamma